MITDDELSKLTDKSSRDPEIVRLYREHDFLTAYAAHTDARVKDNPQLAIGGDWEEYGNIQRDFLIAQGLRPTDTLLDMGCGTGRLARKIVPYLNDGQYCGCDISAGAIQTAKDHARIEGWFVKNPDFYLLRPRDLPLALPLWSFDFVWAFSVFIHLPSEAIPSIFKTITLRLSDRGRRGKFYFSYVPTDLADNTRTGLKQFKHPYSFYEKVAADLGYELKQVPWPGRQRIALISK